MEALRLAKYERILEANPSITPVRGHARFEGPHRVAVEDENGSARSLCTDRVVIATGAGAVIPPIPGLAGTAFWTSAEALVAKTLPVTCS